MQVFTDSAGVRRLHSYGGTPHENCPDRALKPRTPPRSPPQQIVAAARIARVRFSHQTVARARFDAEAHPAHGAQRTRTTPEDEIEIRYLDDRCYTAVHRAQAGSRSSTGNSAPSPSIRGPRVYGCRAVRSSLALTVSITRPAYITRTRSQKEATRSRSWLMKMSPAQHWPTRVSGREASSWNERRWRDVEEVWSTSEGYLHVRENVSTSYIPSFQTSDYSEYFSINTLLHQQLRKPLHQWTQTMLRPIRDVLIQHQSLPEQRMRAVLHRVRPQPPIIPQTLPCRTQQGQQSNRQCTEQKHPVPPLRTRYLSVA